MVGLLQLQKLLVLIGSCIQPDANGAFHRQKLSTSFILFSILKKGAALPPRPKGRGLRAVLVR